MYKNFTDRIINAHGDAGKQLLDRIPDIIKKYEKLWNITVDAPFELSYNYVAPAISKDNREVVLKIGLHGHNEFNAEHDALKIFNGDGIVKMLQSNPDEDVMLLEKVSPGTPVSNLTDDYEATHAIIFVMKKLWKPISQNHSFPTLKDWFKGFDRLRKKFNGTTGPLPDDLVKKGEELYRYLIETSSEQYLLHGDLHHDNVLSSDREKWLAIDPDAVIGERVHDTAAMLRNPDEKLMKLPNLKPLLSRRIDILSESLGLDKERIRQWGIAQNVLSAIWSVEDEGEGWERSLRVAQTLVDMKV